MAKKRKVPSPLLEPSSKIIRHEDPDEETGVEESLEEQSESESSEEEDDAEEDDDGEEEDDDEGEEEEEEEDDDDEDEEEEDDDDDDTDEESSDDGAKEEESKRETLRELLKPFEKSQIIDILKRAAAEDQSILPEIIRIADSDTVHRKLFVFGLGWDVTYDQLLQVFKPYGELEECKLITDKNTGRCKGYAFVLFKARAAAKKALKIPQKKIGNRMASCQLAAFGQGSAASDVGCRKIYIGNVGPHLNPEKLYSFFAKFGEIEEGPLGFDPVTNKFRGYAILTFKSVDGYKKAMEEPIKVLENCQLHCKKFIENQNKNNISAKTSSGNMNPALTVDDTCLRLSGGILGTSLDAGRLVIPQNQGIGLMGNPSLALAYNPVGLVPTTPLMGANGDNGMKSYNPNMLGSYGAQGALQSMGIFQNAHAGQSSEATAATRGLTNIVPAPAIYPSYIGHN